MFPPFLCTRVPGARVAEKVIALLDCTRMPGARVAEKVISLFYYTRAPKGSMSAKADGSRRERAERFFPYSIAQSHAKEICR